MIRECRRRLAIYRRQVNNDWMGYSARVASSVLFVAELDRSVNFYRDLFGCVETPRAGEAALLLASGGFLLYLIERGKRAEHQSGGLGYHLLMWATDTIEGLKYFEQTLKEMGRYTENHTAGGVTFAEGRALGGLRVIVARLDPQKSPLWSSKPVHLSPPRGHGRCRRPLRRRDEGLLVQSGSAASCSRSCSG